MILYYSIFNLLFYLFKVGTTYGQIKNICAEERATILFCFNMVKF